MSSYPLFDMLCAAFDRNALGHALLFALPGELVSDSPLALALDRFRALLMCPERKMNEGPCEQCASCKILLSGNAEAQHPDLVRMAPAPDSLNYSVDDVRSLLEQFSLTRSLGANRVAWITQADALCAGGQSAAANSLLKLLEEPRPNSFLVLLTSRPEGLLPTIRSRCQIFRLPRSSAEKTARQEAATEALEEWLALRDWLKNGATPGRGPVLPADDDDFWKERETSIQELERVFEALWGALKDHWGNWDREQAQRALYVFSRLEECLAAVRGYGNPPLQWLQFRMDARLDA